MFAIPTLIVISFIIFALLDLAPGDPTAQLPLTIDAATREQIRKALHDAFVEAIRTAK